MKTLYDYLEPCQKCGGKAEIKWYKATGSGISGAEIKCAGCGYSVGKCFDISPLIHKWNGNEAGMCYYCNYAKNYCKRGITNEQR